MRFAEKNHKLVYAFLQEQRYDPGEYYDLAVMGYLRESGMTYRNPAVSMGGVEGIPEYATVACDERTIAEILNTLS